MKLRATHPFPFQPELIEESHSSLSSITTSSARSKPTTRVRIIEPKQKSHRHHNEPPPPTPISSTFTSSKTQKQKRRHNNSSNKIPQELFRHSMVRKLTIYGSNSIEMDDELISYDKMKSLPYTLSTDRKQQITKKPMQKRKNSQRKHIENEIICTERSYLNNLLILLNELIAPMFVDGMIDRRYYSKIVSSIPLMIQFHKMLLDQIDTQQQQQQRRSNQSSLANVFNRIISQNRERFISIYLKFIVEYNDICDLFGTTFYGNKSLNAFLKQKRDENKPLTNYLILPVQVNFDCFTFCFFA